MAEQVFVVPTQAPDQEYVYVPVPPEGLAAKVTVCPVRDGFGIALADADKLVMQAPLLQVWLDKQVVFN